MDTAAPLDDLISRKAAQFATRIRALADSGANEAEIRIETERQLAFLETEAGITLQGRHEFTVASGRADSVYDRVIIEYKNPSNPSERIGPDARSAGSRKVVEQIKGRFYDMRAELGQPLNTLFGVGFDGRRFIFVRCRDGNWRVQPPIMADRHSAERFMWALLNLGTKGKPFSPEYLARDFGEGASIARRGIGTLYEAIRAADHPKAKTFFRQWRILYSEVCGYDIDDRSGKVVKLAESYGLALDDLRPAQLLFALHTYYAIFMKLLASEIVASFHRLPTPLQRMLQAGSSSILRRAMEELEDGSVFRHLKITNFLEGDLFAWYLSVWSDPIDGLVRDMVGRLDEYNPGTLSEDPASSQDLLKKLYQQLFPPDVRHDLGEYYTPDWLAEHVLTELDYVGDPDKRLLDPACGSGTFLVAAIGRIRKWYEENRETCRYGEGELCRRILGNVMGFDLNPIAVMAARTNYLIAIRGLMAHVDEVEIPVYLCDSVMTPAEYGNLFARAGTVLRIPCAARRPPYLLVPREIAQDSRLVARYASVLEHCLSMPGMSADEFVAMCREDSISVTDERAHRELYEQLVIIRKHHKNGVWARIIKNAFAPLFAGTFDFVAGNPPWVGWEHLPPDYRESSQDVWKAYDLVGPARRGKRQASDASKTDISILMTYVSADKYLKDGGRLGFVITRTVFQSELGGWHFRSFQLPRGRAMRVLKVQDFDPVKPFQGQAANLTSVLLLRVGEPTVYPVPWQVYSVRTGCTVNEDTPYLDSTEVLSTREWTARHIDPADRQSSWVFGDPEAVDVLFRLMGRSHYASLVREGLNTRGANGVYFVDAWLERRQLLVRNRPGDGDDREVAPEEHALEPDYLYPLLKGRNVHRWTAETECFVVVPHRQPHPATPVNFAALPRDTQRFLSLFKEKLQARKKFRNFDPSGTSWYGLYSVLDACFTPDKVVWREMASGSIAAVVSSADLPSGHARVVMPDHKLFMIPCSSPEEAHFVCGMFNSSIASYLIRSYAIATGISAHVLDRLPIPEFRPRSPRHQRVAELSRRCTEAARLGVDTSSAERVLNRAVARVLDVSASDLAAIDSALADLPGGGD